MAHVLSIPWLGDGAKRGAKIVHELVTAENYSDVGSPDETKATRPPLHGAKPTGNNRTQRAQRIRTGPTWRDSPTRVVNEIGRQRVQ
jgi:hypothetical protein